MVRAAHRLRPNPVHREADCAAPSHFPMEPVTHALASIALGRAGFGRLARSATPMLIVSGLAADVDWLTLFWGPRAFLYGHRTATHSLLGAVAISVAVAAGFYFAGRRYAKLAAGWFAALLICGAGTGTHLLLDLLNGYGVMLLWPFGAKWYAWDLADSVDAWILLFLLAGLLTPELFHLVLEEIGSKPKRHGRQRGAIVGLALVLLFLGGRAFAHERAIALLDSREYRGQEPLQVAAFPHASTPLIWSGVVETDNAVANVEVPLFPLSAFDPEQAAVHFKPEETLALKNAGSSAAAREFLAYARYPLASVEPEADGHEVRLRDMRFASEPAGRRGIVAVIELNAQNLVVNARLEFDSAGAN